ncbi:hypothetical protein FRC12_016107 [Ceratobasidium sp. 428]|nr:hypothetical protein FRC12_016107 [Ceratobasidium sp. 428]
MRSKVKTAPPVPLELIRHVAHLSDVSSVKLSLVLLSRACCRDIVSILYRTINITSSNRLDLLSRTLAHENPSLRLLPRSLRIHVGWESRYSGNVTDTSSIRDVLLLVDNLIELDLDIPSSVTLQLLRDCPPESVTFRLKYFSYVLSNYGQPELLKFLSRQSKLEELVQYISPGAWYTSPLPEMAPAEPSALPQLKSLTAGVETICYLVPGRPVSKININECITPAITRPIISKISQTTAFLVHLSILMSGASANGAGVLTWLSGLSRFHESLETLTFRIAPNTAMFDFVRNDLDSFKSALSRFTAIRTFTARSHSGRLDLKPRKPMVPELDHFSWWAEVCPSLTSVSFFGNELSAA